MKNTKASLPKNKDKKKDQQKKEQDWLPTALKPYIRDLPEINELLQRFDSFIPKDWKANDLIEWVANTLSTSLANTGLSDKGYDRAKKIFSKRRIPIEDWALSRPGWWESFGCYRERSLADYFIYEPPEITPEELPLELESWWHLYIKEPVEPNPRRRCAYLVAAGFLQKTFTADDLIMFVAKQRQKPLPDTTYAEWELSNKGDDYLAGIKNLSDQSHIGQLSNSGNDSKTTEGIAVNQNEPSKELKNKSTNTVNKLAHKLGVTKWENITIYFNPLNGWFIVKGGGKPPQHCSPDKLGMARGKTKEDASYPLTILSNLILFQKKYHYADERMYQKDDGYRRFKRHLSLLNDKLRKVFGLDGTPVNLDRQRKVTSKFKTAIWEEEVVVESKTGNKRKTFLKKEVNTGRYQRVDLTDEQLDAAGAIEMDIDAMDDRIE